MWPAPQGVFRAPYLFVRAAPPKNAAAAFLRFHVFTAAPPSAGGGPSGAQACMPSPGARRPAPTDGPCGVRQRAGQRGTVPGAPAEGRPRQKRRTPQGSGAGSLAPPLALGDGLENFRQRRLQRFGDALVLLRAVFAVLTRLCDFVRRLHDPGQRAVMAWLARIGRDELVTSQRQQNVVAEAQAKFLNAPRQFVNGQRMPAIVGIKAV